MGRLCFRSSDSDPDPPAARAPGEPDPRSFTIVSKQRSHDYVIAEVQFPDCTTYEGRKILVYRRRVFDRVQRAGVMDPHFLEHGDCPLARFAPTADGMRAAQAMVTALEKR